MVNSLAKLLSFRPSRRWGQFSLRTAFMVVTVSCAALGLWCVPAERQRRAVAAIEKLGGGVTYVEPAASETFPVPLLRRWLPPDYFDEIGSINLYNTQVTDAGLAHLQGLTGLQGLSLHGTQVTDAGLARLQGLTGLKWLDLNNTQVTDAGLARLQGLTGLQELWLDGAQVTDAGLAHLQGLTALQALDLNNTQVTDAGLAKLRKALPNCEIYGPRPAG